MGTSEYVRLMGRMQLAHGIHKNHNKEKQTLLLKKHVGTNLFARYNTWAGRGPSGQIHGPAPKMVGIPGFMGQVANGMSRAGSGHLGWVGPGRATVHQMKI